MKLEKGHVARPYIFSHLVFFSKGRRSLRPKPISFISPSLFSHLNFSPSTLFRHAVVASTTTLMVTFVKRKVVPSVGTGGLHLVLCTQKSSAVVVVRRRRCKRHRCNRWRCFVFMTEKLLALESKAAGFSFSFWTGCVDLNQLLKEVNKRLGTQKLILSVPTCVFSSRHQNNDTEKLLVKNFHFLR